MKIPKNQTNRQMEVTAIRKLAKALAPADYLPHRTCIYHAAATLLYIGRVWGKNDIIIQAGSASWPIINMEDDGIQLTHFSYNFDIYHPMSAKALKEGLLPEMHAWCVDRKFNLVIDPTTCYIPTVCKEMAHLPYKGDIINYIWCKAENLEPAHVVYVADWNAITIAQQSLAQTMNHAVKEEFLKTGVVPE